MTFPDELTDKELAHFKHLVMELADRSPILADAFTEASKSVLTQLTVDQRTYWADMGMRLSSHGWKSINLACELFANSADMLKVASTANIVRFVNILDEVSVHSVELASSFLKSAPGIFQALPREHHAPYLDLAETIAARSKADIWLYFERGPRLLNAFTLPSSNKFVTLAVRIISQSEQPPFSLLSTLSEAVTQRPAEEHLLLCGLAARIADRDVAAAAAFLESVSHLRERISTEDLESWVERGLAVGDLRAFFTLESASAESVLADLSGRVEFEREANMLQLFGQALAGESVHVQPLRALAQRHTGWRAGGHATTDGHNIFVPEYIDSFRSRSANLEAYRVCIAHQSGRLEFASFGFRFGLDGGRLPSSLHEREVSRGRREKPAIDVPMHRFFNLFDDKRLIHTLFWLAEDARVDVHVTMEYPGLTEAARRIKAFETSRRPSPERLPLRQALLENLVRATLGGHDSIRWPAALEAILTKAAGVLDIARSPGATVQDSAEVSAWLYDLAVSLPNARAVAGAWQPLDPLSVPHYDDLPEIPVLPIDLPDDGQSAFSVAPPAHWGDFKPELVQTHDELMSRPDLDELDAEQLRELIENSVEIEDELVAEQLLQQLVADQEEESESADAHWEAWEGPAELENEDEVISWSHYDEWDFRANDYLSGWCHVGERRVPEGESIYYEDTLARHHGLVLEIRKQFEMMRPESHRKIKNLHDGHEIDLEQAIQFFVDKKAGSGPTARFYSRRDKIERSVAAAFLLDMSWSTDEPAGQGEHESNRRIIDIERDAAVLVIEALEAIGDAYGIFGFSGYGRRNVSFHVIKDLGEPHDESVRRRVDGIRPLRSTRMGAAIRHTRAKLEAHPARVKLMILISDGRPQDQGYGESRDDYDYAVHDTRQALLEVKHAGMVPFLITVDREGPDYLKALCGDIGYEIVGDLESLPRRLPSIYRYLATG